jgi:hypothetical protein
MLSSHLRLGLQNSLLFSGILAKIMYAYTFFLISHAYCIAPSM